MKNLQRLILSKEVSERVAAKLKRTRWEQATFHEPWSPETAPIMEATHDVQAEEIDGHLVILWRRREHEFMSPRRLN